MPRNPPSKPRSSKRSKPRPSKRGASALDELGKTLDALDACLVASVATDQRTQLARDVVVLLEAAVALGRPADWEAVRAAHQVLSGVAAERDAYRFALGALLSAHRDWNRQRRAQEEILNRLVRRLSHVDPHFANLDRDRARTELSRARAKRGRGNQSALAILARLAATCGAFTTTAPNPVSKPPPRAPSKTNP